MEYRIHNTVVSVLIEVNLVSDGLPAHVTRGEGLGAYEACAVTAHKGDRAAPFHADAAAVRFLNVCDLTLQVPQAVRGRQASLAGKRTTVCKNRKHIEE